MEITFASQARFVTHQSRVRDSGVTDFNAAIAATDAGAFARTFEFLAAVKSEFA